MLHASKFVNTKAYQKALDKKNPLKFPILGNSETDAPKLRTPEPNWMRDREQEPRPKPSPVVEESAVEKPKVHGSVNFEKMQQIEELHKQDEDWLAFFMGKTAPQQEITYSSTVTDLVPVSSFAEPAQANASPESWCQPAPAVADLIGKTTLEPPVISEGPSCLEEIFNDMSPAFKVSVE